MGNNMEEGAEMMIDEQLKSIFSQLQSIEKQTEKMNYKIHRRYTSEDLKEIRRIVRKREGEAIGLYNNLIDQENGDRLEIKENEEIYVEIGRVSNNRSLSLGDQNHKLLNLYNKLHYSFHTASELTKNQISKDANPVNIKNTGIILLFKNVRILEDLISKICTNNIDKSIVSGEQHFDSIRYGLEWLFCHEELSDPGEQNPRRQLDIRDTNRYLDYIKYQIMCSKNQLPLELQSSSGIDALYERIKDSFNEKDFAERTNYITDFKTGAKELIRVFSQVYEILIKFRDALLLEEEIRKSLGRITHDGSSSTAKVMDLKPQNLRKVINLSSVAVRVMLDRFVSFVKISDLNFGNSTFYRAWFNYSELSKSNYAGSNFKYARIENAKMKDCDISTSNLILADGGHTDFSNSNFNYSNMTGINLVDATVNHCEFQNAAFLDPNIELYKNAINEVTSNQYNYPDSDDGRELQRKLEHLCDIWRAGKKRDRSINTLILDIVDFYKQSIQPESLGIRESDEKQKWRILVHSEYQQLGITLRDKTRNLLKQFLNAEISSELLMSMGMILATEGAERKKQRIKKHGNILLEIADMTSISAKNSLLGGNNLSHVKMANASFENADMSGVRMYYTHSRATSFISTNLNHADCFESEFYLASFANAVMNNATFLNCNLNHTNWNSAIIVGTTFMDTSQFLENTIFDGQTKRQVFITEQCISNKKDARVIQDFPHYQEWESWGTAYTKLSKEYWQMDCGIKDASFEDTLADSTVFLNMVADRSRFNRASFRNSIWANCRAFLSDFIETDLRYSRISFCCMGQSNFSGANITNAVLSYVDFSGCNLEGTLFNRCLMDHVLIQSANVRTINISEAVIKNSAFEDCKFIGAIVAGTVFSNCVFSNVDFSQLKGFHSSRFEDCYFYNCQNNDYLTEDGGPTRLRGKVNPREYCG